MNVLLYATYEWQLIAINEYLLMFHVMQRMQGIKSINNTYKNKPNLSKNEFKALLNQPEK